MENSQNTCKEPLLGTINNNEPKKEKKLVDLKLLSLQSIAGRAVLFDYGADDKSVVKIMFLPYKLIFSC